MTRVVLDTNIVVSAALRADGNEAAVLRLVAEGTITPCATPAILAEYASVLCRPSLRLDAKKVRKLLATICDVAVVVAPTLTLQASPDEADNRFIECAETVGADFLVTGNLRHFPQQWKGTRTVNCRTLLALLKGER